ncbi:MAG: hypothetical protein HYZ13_14900 [Acidobacteria bacterium]|nr:hypothetical protein [Acidobacteriota bacterium]
MTSGTLREHDDHKVWITQIAGATFYLRGLYQRLGDSQQAARAEQAGQMAQEQLHRVTLDSSARIQEASKRLRQVEAEQGDPQAEQMAWKEALIGLLAIAIWAGVADAIEERATPSPVCRKASKALAAGLDASKTAFPDDLRVQLVDEMTKVAVDGSIEGLKHLAGEMGDEGESIVAIMGDQVRKSVAKYLSAWNN